MARPPVDSKLDKFIDKLGKFPDQDIAELAGVSRTAVVNFRKRQGIDPYAGYKFAPGGGQVAAAKAAVPVAKAPAAAAVASKPAPAAPVAKAPAAPAAPAKVAAPPAPVVKIAAPVAVAAPPPVAAPLPVAAPVAPKAAAPTTNASPARIAFAVTAEVGTDARSYVVVAADIVSATRAAVDLVAARHKNGSVKGVVRVAEVL